MVPPQSYFPSARITDDGNGVLVRVQQTLRAGRNQINGIKSDVVGPQHLMVSVTVVPEDDPARIHRCIDQHGCQA